MPELPHQSNSARGRAKPSVTIGSEAGKVTFVRTGPSPTPEGATAYVDAGDAGGFYVDLSPAMCAYLAGFLASAGGVER